MSDIKFMPSNKKENNQYYGKYRECCVVACLNKKEIEYTDYGKSEMNKIMGFVTYMKSHDVFLKEDNPILYYDYLLYSYGICNSNLLLRDNDMKKIYIIIKKYIYEN